ncbi:MAG: molybdenum ABC transporter ATP-binding protein [Pseudomonadota bacterium]
MISLHVRKRLHAFSLDAAFDAPAGVTAIYGRSGSGKTTLVNAVAGLLRPDEGRIAVGATTLFDASARIDLPVQRRRIGYVFQDARLFPHMTVTQNLRYGGDHDADRIIGVLGLAHLLDRLPARLSGGERQRVALGRALMSDPQVLLLDEPLAALDSQRKQEIMPYLEHLRDSLQIPQLYVSHDMAEVARLATTLVVLEAGQVAAHGPLADVLTDPTTLPVIGARQAGAILQTTIAGRLLDDNLTELAFSGGRLMLPGMLGQLGEKLRLRIPAQDVILAREKPQGISALNVLQATITQIAASDDGNVAVRLRAGDDHLLARVTARSAARMGLQTGQAMFAVVKATAIAGD